MASNSSLNNAFKVKQDEFYTQLTDIENELRHYKEFFRGKTVLCNCDDPYESNFFKYFAMGFNGLGLKKLIATCYATSPVLYTQLTLFGEEQAIHGQQKKPYKVEITEVSDENGDGRVDLADVEHLLKNRKNVLTLLQGDGDFRSEECIALLEEADVVVTNPPFSLFREYVDLLMEYKKDFLIIGSQNAVTYKEIFPLIRDNKMWLGYYCGDMEFTVPDYYEPKETRYREENGVKYRSMGNVCWYTNIDIAKRHEKLILYKKFDPAVYPHYINFDGIDVGKVTDIPCDYDGIMGITSAFLHNYNPEQFEIISLGNGDSGKSVGVGKNHRGRTDLAYVKDGVHKVPFTRILIRRRSHED